MPVKLKEQSIAIVVCYLGKLPWYFDYFVLSCSHNPSVDFFIVTDDTTCPKPLPVNVKFIFSTLQEINTLATANLGFATRIENGYKLCDFKPTYGIVFNELLKDYDFWGFGDIDVIFGNIRTFITDELLNNYDLISVRPDWIPGCFVLFKNCDKMNKLFMLSRDYKKVLMSDKHYCFDETNFAHDAFTDGLGYKEINTEIESMMHVIKKMEEQNYIRTYYDLFIIEGIPGKLQWYDGMLTYRKKYEILLYHLIRLKKIYHPLSAPKNIPKKFSISPTRIYFG